MDVREARAALDEMDAARRALAQTGPAYPLWRHAAFAAAIAVMVAGQGFGPKLAIPMLVAAIAGIAWLTTDDRKRYGLFVSGYRWGRTLPLTLGLVVVMLGAMAAEIHARSAGLSITVKLAIAAGAFVIAFATSLLWTRLYQRELSGGAR